MLTNQPYRALRILKCSLDFGIERVTVLHRRTRVRDAVLQQHAVDAARGQPVADLCALSTHGKSLITATGKYQRSDAAVAILSREKRDRGNVHIEGACA